LPGPVGPAGRADRTSRASRGSGPPRWPVLRARSTMAPAPTSGRTRPVA